MLPQEMGCGSGMMSWRGVRAFDGGKNWTEVERSPEGGSKRHLLVDAQSLPVNIILTKANRHDVTQLLPLVDGVHLIGESVGGH